MEEISKVLEINPQEYFSNMKEDIYNSYSQEKLLNINEDYLSIRADIISLIHKISKKMGFKSQTFFLSVYYLDIIMLENKNINIDNFYLLALSCFIVASKYSENDPIVPPLENFLHVFNRYNSNFNKRIRMKDLFEMEVKILKYLNYDMHYITIYDFNLFFFNHGIIKKQQIKDIINNNVNYINKNNKSDISNEDDDNFILDGIYIKKILEKIYKKSRYYLDLIVINDKICFKYNALLLAIYIMKRSIEEVILNEYKVKNKDFYMNKRQIIRKTNLYFKEVMNNFYKIDYESDEKYQELIRDKDLINIFQRQEKIQENLHKEEESKANLVKFLPKCKKNTKENYIRKINITNIGFVNSNLTTSYNIEENRTPMNSQILSKPYNLSQYNSKEKIKIKSIEANNTLFENYYNNINNKVFYTKTFHNSKKYLIDNSNNNSNIDINKKNITNRKTNYNSYIEKGKINCTFTQLKNNLKKNFSLNKKRCKDRYSHIDNLKSLCKLSSCSNTIKNIKEASFIKNRIYQKNCSNEKNLNEENERINSIIDNTNNNIVLIRNLRKVKNIKYYPSKDKINKKNNLNIFDSCTKSDLYQSIKNYNENEKNKSCDESFHSKKSINKEKEAKEEKEEKEKKTKNLIRIKFRTNTENENYINKNNNQNKPYFKKVIHNFDPMNRRTVNKNSVRINISNILEKSNFNNDNCYRSTTNKNNNFISLSNNNNNNNDENKLNLIRKRIISINKRNANLDNLLVNKSNNSFGAKLFKDINNFNANNKKEFQLNNYNAVSKDSELKYLSHNKIPKIPKNLKIKTNFVKNNITYDLNQSPIGFIKEIKSYNISNNEVLKTNNNEGQDLGIKISCSTIETTSNSYHKKKVINSLNKKKNKILNSFLKNRTINEARKSNNLNFINPMKFDGKSFFKKYTNSFISSGKNNNLNNNVYLTTNAINSLNTIDSTKNNIEINKTIENGHF